MCGITCLKPVSLSFFGNLRRGFLSIHWPKLVISPLFIRVLFSPYSCSVAECVTLLVLPWLLNSTAKVLQAECSLCPSRQWLHDGLDAAHSVFIQPGSLCHSLKLNQHPSRENALYPLILLPLIYFS